MVLLPVEMFFAFVVPSKDGAASVCFTNTNLYLTTAGLADEDKSLVVFVRNFTVFEGARRGHGESFR